MKNDTYGGGEVIKNEIQITVCSISRVEYFPKPILTHQYRRILKKIKIAKEVFDKDSRNIY